MIAPQTGLVTSQAQTQVLAPQLRQGLRLLAMNLADLRQELIREMSVNPVIDDIESTLEKSTVSDIAEEERPLAELLIADLDADGYFRGSVEDLAMVSGEDEAAVRGLLRKISALYPAGCGATTHQECLLAQLDEIDEPVLRPRDHAVTASRRACGEECAC